MRLRIKKPINIFTPTRTVPELSHARLGRTPTSTVMEGIAVIEAVAMWAVVARLAMSADSSHTLTPIMLGAAGTAITAVLLYGAYRPTETVNLPLRIKTVRQVQLMALLERTTALLIPPTTAILAVMECGLSGDMPLKITGAVVLCNTLVFTLLIWRAGR